MYALLLMVGTFFGYIIMYRIYGEFIGKKIFNISRENRVPSKEFEDGVDFVPSKKSVIFGHHFTSIAGTGPIVGPAIAIIWGWLPALIWVFFGSIVIGAVHDFGSLVISMRNSGKSISDYTAKYINPRTRLIFFILVFLELWVVISIFGLVIALIFNMFPSSVMPVWLQVPIAITLGYMVYKKNMKLAFWSIVAIIIMYLTIFAGTIPPLDSIKMPAIGGIPPTGVWTILLLIYAFIASVLPVTTLLQPRDFINSHQLVVAMVLMVAGILVSAFSGKLELVAPMVQTHPADAPSMWPFLFITIACGAISGFHSLVSSGTSSKQVKCETDSLFIGYGSMLIEGILATLVIIAVAAGIGMGYEGLSGFEAWNKHYASWGAAKGLSAKISAFVVGSANMMKTMGISHKFAMAVMGVLVASFAGTTLDSATRIQRYVVTEMFSGVKLKIFHNRYFITLLVVVSAGFLAFSGKNGPTGNGALSLWPLFGALNQTLAALALFVITLYLRAKGGLKWIVAGIPAVFMALVTIQATVENQMMFISRGDIFLSLVNGVIILIAIWVIIESVIRFFKK